MNIYIPIPVYVTLSVLVFSACITNIIVNPTTTTSTLNHNIKQYQHHHIGIKELFFDNYLNLAVIINTTFTLLIVFGKFIQYLFFGQLRDIEARNFNDRLWTYVVSKLIFIFAAKEPELRSLLIWGFWFSILCCLKLFSLLSRDRFDYLNTFLPNTHAKIHLKLLMLLVGILISDLIWFYFSTTYFFKEGLSNLMLLNFECFTIFFETVQTLIKYSIHLFDLSSEDVWDKRGQYIYYTEFSTDSVILAGTCAHLIHIIIIQGFTPTLLHVVMFFYFKMVFGNLNRKITAYRNYCKLTSDMDNCYPNVSEKDLENYNDDCAICRDRMVTAKKLPCAHIFHHSCLRAWLKQHHSCPTCRRSLIDEHQHHISTVNGGSSGNGSTSTVVNPLTGSGSATGNASTALSHSPLSVSDDFGSSSSGASGSGSGITHNTIANTGSGLVRSLSRQSLTTSQYNNLIYNANYIHGLFENISIQTIQNDLLRTNNVNRTIDNILEGRLIEPSNNNNNNSNNSINNNKNEIDNNDEVTSPSKNIRNHNSKEQSDDNESDDKKSNNNSSNLDRNKINNSNNNNNNNNSNLNGTIVDSKTINPFEINNNINNNSGDSEKDKQSTLSSTKPLEKFSDSFKSTSQERYTSLQQRKKSMLEASRKHFLETIDTKND